MTIKTLGIISVATNIYLEYWKSQAKSVAKNIGPNLDVTLHIFTDQPEEAEAFGSELENVKIVGHRIPGYRWPEATLYRYRIFNSAKDELTQDVLVYLDADMIVHQPMGESDFSTQSGTGMTLVRHPGYFRPGVLARAALYLSSPKLALGDFYSTLRVGGIGAWDTNPESKAFVPKKLRTQYFCGGTWWGYRDDFLALVEELDNRVTQDELAGVMAKWHDESHINWWGANHAHETKSPSYCYSVSYKWLSGLPMAIQAVDKVEATR
jgi:Glycosyltransferase family 6